MLLGTPARAEESRDVDAAFERIQMLVRTADFDRAEAAARELLAGGHLGRGGVSHAYLELGIIASARSDPLQAERSFSLALRLEPSTVLPASAGPHVTAAFERAKQRVDQEPPLRVRAELYRGPSAVDIRLWVEGPSEELVHALVVTGPGFRRALPIGDRRALLETLPLSAGACIELSASITDENGNVLFPDLARAEPCPRSASSEAEVAARVSPPPRPKGDIRSTSTRASRPIPAYVWAGASVTVVLGALTTVFGVRAIHANSDYEAARDDPNQSDETKKALHDEAEDAELAPNVLGAATAVTAGATLVLYLTRPSARSVAIAPRLGPREAGMVLVGGF
jgi:hypothetical protein